MTAPGIPPGRPAEAAPKGMPLGFRIPAIIVAIAILWWVMNGGAKVLINGAIESIVRPDRSVENAPAIAAAARPEGFAWLDKLLRGATSPESPVPALRGLAYVIFEDGVRDASLPEGIHSGSFYDGDSQRAFFDVACFAAIDQFARPRPDLVKAFAVTIVLARRTQPGLEGEALVTEAGRIAGNLKLFPQPPSGRTPAALASLPLYLQLFDKQRDEDRPPGWVNHHLLPPDVTREEAAAAFSAGLTQK